MKDFTDLPSRPPAPLAKPSEDRQFFIKRNLANTAERSPEVIAAIFDWLTSFPSGITKKEFTNQLCKLDKDDEKAIKQLQDSKNKRTIKPIPRQKPPKLEISVLKALGLYHFVAIEGQSGRKFIDKFLDTIPEGGVYILDVNELILEYTDYQHRGRAGEIIEAANHSSILVVEGLEKPIALAYHIKDTLFQLVSVRKKDKDKYTLSTWNYTHAWYISEYGEFFTHFSV